MYILSAQQIREWDHYTIQYEPVLSVELMERAARKCADWIEKQGWQEKHFRIFCGKGNNGGDGLAIARMLFRAGYTLTVYILETGKLGSQDFETNLQRLHELPVDIHFIQAEESLPLVSSNDIIIDALFGSGLNQPLKGLPAHLVQHINSCGALIISIDLPSGLFIDESSKGNDVIKAHYTLSFQCYKLGLLVQQNAALVGEVHILDIGLHPGFLQQNNFTQQVTAETFIKKILKPRNAFAHKGNFGHALIVAGSYGKMGAAILAAKACVHSGAGLTTAYIPKCGYVILQVAIPEVMVITDENENHLSSLPAEIEKYTVIGIGPGIDTKDATQKMLSFIIRRYHKPLVIDADGLNCLSLQPDLLRHLPLHSILTPHPKEFDRMFGEHENDFDRIATAHQKAKELNIIIVLKGHYTLIASPSGNLYFNSTGNAGMAKGGSGDVLTGIVTALVSQGYQPEQAAILGVYLHGFAGDLAARALSHQAMAATDLVTFLSRAFLELV